MRKEHTTLKTVGELKSWLSDLPDDLPIGRLTNGYYHVNVTGDVGFFVGKLPIGHHGEMDEQTILRISA